MTDANPGLEVLYVEDSDYLRELTIEFFRELGHNVVAVFNADLALENLAKRTFDVMMTDVSLPGMSGLELAKSVAERYPQLPIVISSGHDTITEALLIEKLQHNFRVLPKPYDLETFQKVIEEITRRS